MLKAPSINPRRNNANDDLALDSTGVRLDSAPSFAHTSRVTGRVSTANLLVDDAGDGIVNAIKSATVTFAVSGLDHGDTGSVTFTDASKQHVVVSVDGNGTYSANLSTLTDGQISSSLGRRWGRQPRDGERGNARYRQRIDTKPFCRCHEIPLTSLSLFLVWKATTAGL